MNRYPEIDVVEQVVRGCVKASSVRMFFTGMHNAFAHGEICKDVDSEDLAEMFNHFEKLIEIGKKYE
jgi:hypothetical protein